MDIWIGYFKLSMFELVTVKKAAGSKELMLSQLTDFIKLNYNLEHYIASKDVRRILVNAIKFC